MSAQLSPFPVIACFACNSAEFPSYLKSGQFSSLLYSEQEPPKLPVKLFGKMITNSSLFANLDVTFKDLKRTFSVVKGLAFENDYYYKEAFVSFDIKELRCDISKTFYILSSNMQAVSKRHNTPIFDDDDGNSHLKNIVVKLTKELKNLLVYVGRLSSVNGLNKDSYSICGTSRSAANFDHYYHLCLDVWFNCTTLLYLIYNLYPVNVNDVFYDFIDESIPFLQVAYFLVYELSYLAFSQYKSANSCSSSPFMCPCIKQLWITIIYLTDKFSIIHGEKCSFWNVYLKDLQIILKNPKSQSLGLFIDMFSGTDNPPEKLVEACLWLTSHIAPLFKYDTYGHFFDYDKAKSGYIAGKYLVQNLISVDAKEKALRIALSYCTDIIKLWEPSGDMLLPLTDLFLKKVEDTFIVHETNLSYIFKDSVSWFTYITDLSNHSFSNKTSFDIYLCMLNLQLSSDINNSLWRSLKGRIYVKFIPKKIKELSEVGLQNIFSLFHVIVSVGHLEIVDKMFEIARITETSRDQRKQIISWKAFFVLLYIFKEKKFDTEKVVTMLSNFFNSTCSDYSKVNRACTLKYNLMKLLNVYIDNMANFFEKKSCQNVYAYQLLSKGFLDLLPACDASEVEYILNVVYRILKIIQNVSQSDKADLVYNETECVQILQSIFSNIYPHLESVAVSGTAPLVVSDIAANLTKLLSDFSSLVSDASFDFLRIFMYFAFKETVNISLTCQYLSFILGHPSLLSVIKLKLKNFDLLIFQSWMKCVIYTPTTDYYIRDLTQKVLCQPTIAQFYSNAGVLTLEGSDHVGLAVNFFELVGNAFAQCSQEEKIKIARNIQQLFKNYVIVAVRKIQQDKERQTFSHVYKLTSSLVEHCSSVLNLRATSESVLLNILDKAFYPKILFPKDEKLQNLVLLSIKEYLPAVMRGLFKLDYRNDQSIEREIRNIFTCYTIMLPNSSNPLMKLVIDSACKEPGALNSDEFNFILKISKHSMLSKYVEKPINIFKFYQEILEQVPSSCKMEISNTLLTCALEICMDRSGPDTEYLKTLIKNVLIFFRDKIKLADSKKILIPTIQWFVDEKLQWCAKRGFDILVDIFSEYVPEVMVDVYPILTRSVEAIEYRRGSGEDRTLRHGIYRFYTKVKDKMIKDRVF